MHIRKLKIAPFESVSSSMFGCLLESVRLGPVETRNRVFSPPHGTTLGAHGTVSEAMIAYHRERARGGVGLIVLEGMTLHPSYSFEESFLYAGSDRIIPGLARLADACRTFDTPVFGQLFHAGRAVRLSRDGSRPVTYSASDVPDERYRVVPSPMPNEMVWEVIESYAQAAGRLAESGLDGVEILASMGYLIAQFLNPKTNLREDEFGGGLVNRMRILREILVRCRERIGPDRTLGVRITLDEKSDDGASPEETLDVCRILDQDDLVDYFSVIAGSSASMRGWVHVFPPMAVPHAFVAEDARALKQVVRKPVLVAGRINQPQIAADIIQKGHAEMVGLGRALIADPEFVNKLARGEPDSIRACVACNQACVGHRLAHHAVSCIQHPRSGRETLFPEAETSAPSRKILVIGAGPGGMKAAALAADSGHDVLLVEQSGVLGGQVRLAERLPGRAEFGGVITNLEKELEASNAAVLLDTPASEEVVREHEPDLIIVATGARARLPDSPVDGIRFMDSWSAIEGGARAGHRVVIADWACDWAGLGLAHKYALEGHHVRLLSSGTVPGESLQGIVRDQWIAEIDRLGVETTPYARFFGAEDGTAWFQHTVSDETIVCEEVDTLISCYAPSSNRAPEWLEASGIPLRTIGDAVSPRTVEEAILEAWLAISSIGGPVAGRS